MREDNLHPKVIFGGRGSRSMRIKFKYQPTQEEFDTAMARIVEAMEFANKITNSNIHIVSWGQEES